LRGTLVGGAVLMLAVVLVGLEAPLAIAIEHRLMSDFRSEATSQTAFLAGQIADPVARAAEVVQEAPHPGQSLTVAVNATVAATRGKVLVIDRQLRVLADSTGQHPTGLPLDPPSASLNVVLRDSDTRPLNIVDARGSEFIVAVPVQEGGQVVGAIRLVESLAGVQSRITDARWRLAGGGLLALLGGALLAALLATTVVRPVRHLEEAAKQLGDGDLDARADASQLTELASLANSFNTMADHLSSNVSAQREFAANASHQLKTPLTGLKLTLEAILAGDSASDVGSRKALEQVDRLDRLAQDLLLLAQASTATVTASPVDLGEMAETVVEHWQETARRAGKNLTFETGRRAVVRADPADVEQMLDNLVDNAIRYSEKEATITVATDATIASVEDSGPGLTEEDRARVFERFYRGSRAPVSRGTGLGLPIVVELARRWRAQVVAVPAPGTRIEIRFPSDPAGG
jgi:signal transduction histidine kinase